MEYRLAEGQSPLTSQLLKEASLGSINVTNTIFISSLDYETESLYQLNKKRYTFRTIT
jgi:hypothetical protein